MEPSRVPLSSHSQTSIVMGIDDSSGSPSILASRVTGISTSPIPMRTHLVRVSLDQKMAGSCESLSPEILLSSHRKWSSSERYEGLSQLHRVRTIRSLLIVSHLMMRVTRCEDSSSAVTDISMRLLGRVRVLTMRILGLCEHRVSIV